MTTKIHPSEDPMQLADTAIGRALLTPIDRTIQALAQPQSPATLDFTPLEREVLCDSVKADRAAAVPTEWAPLINLIGEAQLGNFMHMGSVGDIQLYKHIWTRRYVNVDDKGQTYQRTAGVVPSGYEPIPQDQALRYVLS